jgi:hypothetical protein
MTTTPSGTPCPRNLPQHFNGCTCTAAPGQTTGEVDLDLMNPTPTGETLVPIVEVDSDGNEVDNGPYMPTEFTFPAWKAAKAIASIDKANRRAERAGIEERFTYDLEKFEKRSTDPLTGLDKVEQMTTLRLNRPSVRHEGWEFTGTLTWDEEVGMISRVVPGADLTDRPDERTCDVCGQQRDRKDTYVVQRTNPETGEREQLQVGSNCLTRFMGIKPAGLWMLEFDVDTSEGETEPPEGTRGAPDIRRDSRQVLAVALATAKIYGWVSRSAANAYNEAGGSKTATADRVAEVIRNSPRTEEARRAIEEILAQASEMGDDADSLLAETREMDGDSEYATNMRAIASAETVGMRNMGMLVSAVGSRQARIDREAKAAAAGVSEFVGKPKDKIERTAEVISARFYENGFDGKTLVLLRDTDGNVFKWWATGRKDDEITEGSKVSMKATVKNHEEYQGVKQTVILRAKLTEVD